MDFALILLVGSILTGILYAIDKWKYEPERVALAEKLKTELGDNASDDQIEKILKPNFWYDNARAFFPVFVVVLALRSFLIEPFRIPSGSMLPTLLIGDFILVNKFAYGIKLPVINKKIIDVNDPERGDVVVFKYPNDERIDYIKRVVGLPGDKLTIRASGSISITPFCQEVVQSCPESYAVEQELTEDVFEYKKFPHSVFNESLGGDTHLMMNAPGRSPLDIDRVIEVPPGHYFVMGDNRDHSADSRVWGFVPEQNLVGKAF
ncbi:MAG: signal peptidase I, partial [Kangiellaceae bacterium]|nr:signal peptidase I [Kangiellaceae bacterium]